MHSATLKSIILALFLLHLSSSSPVKMHHRNAAQDNELLNQDAEAATSELTSEELDQRIKSLKHRKHELLKYKRILEDLNEILTDYDDNEYVDLAEGNAHHEDLMELLKHMHDLQMESRKKSETKHGRQAHSDRKHERMFIDYNPDEMQGDMPSQNTIESEENVDRRPDTKHLSPNVLEKFNLTREDLLALTASRMQGRGEGGFKEQHQADTPQQDAVMTMSPQKLREVYNLTVNGDGTVQWDRNLGDDEFAARAKQLALQQYRKSMLAYFQHPLGINNESNAKLPSPAQAAGMIPASLSRRPAGAPHMRPPLDDAHKAFLRHAQQYQHQQDQAAQEPSSTDSKDMRSNDYREKTVAYHPRCELPKNTDMETWNDGTTLNLLFNVSASVSDKPNLILDAAILRVYKLAGNSTLPNRNGNSDEDEQVRISIAWYTRSLKKHRVKRRISDSKMVPIGFSGWIELNLKGGVSSWKSGRNHGVALIVEDQEGAVLRADNFIQRHDCNNNYPRPFPWFVQKKLTMDETHYRFPRLDVSTRETASYDYQVMPSLVNTFHHQTAPLPFEEQSLSSSGVNNRRTHRQAVLKETTQQEYYDDSRSNTEEST